MQKLAREELETIILTSEASDVYDIFTYDSRSIDRLQDFTDEYPDAARRVSENGFGGVTFVVNKSNFFWSLVAPYSEKRRQALAEQMKINRKQRGAQKDKPIS